MKAKISRIRLLKFCWRWRNPLWAKTRKNFIEFWNSSKDFFEIEDNFSAVYKLPLLFLRAFASEYGGEYCIKYGHKKSTLFLLSIAPKDFIDEYFFYRVIQLYKNPRSIDCTVTALLKHAPHLIDKIYDHVTNYNLHYWTNALADFSTSEYACLQLIKLNHHDILRRVAHKYDPHVLCWGGLAFDQPQLFEQYYPGVDHNRLVDMIENQTYISTYISAYNSSTIYFPHYKKDQTLDFLCEKQRERIMIEVGEQRDTKKRKM